MTTQKRIVSGIRATGSGLHLGNYLGALKPWVRMQSQAQNFLFIADLHGLTTPEHAGNLATNTREIAAAYIAAGIDPAHCVLFAQSSVKQHTELGWIFSCITPMGWLNRMTQFKDKAGKHKEQAGLGLYAYPVLMAADILMYKATHVPTGDDQKQHVELARDIAGAFNRAFGTEIFPLPEPVIQGQAARVMSLRDGTKKMSKSDESDYSRINLTDDADAIALKIRKAKTDPHPLPATLAELESRPEADNLISIYAALADTSREAVLAEYAGASFSTFKEKLADLTVAQMAPITADMRRLMSDAAHLDAILSRSAELAATEAEATMRQVRAGVGLWSAGD